MLQVVNSALFYINIRAKKDSPGMELSGIMFSAADEHDRRAAVINALHMQSPLISLADHKHHDMPRRRVIAIDLRYPRKPFRNRNLLPAEKLMILFPELFFQSLSAPDILPRSLSYSSGDSDGIPRLSSFLSRTSRPVLQVSSGILSIIASGTSFPSGSFCRCT